MSTKMAPATKAPETAPAAASATDGEAAAGEVLRVASIPSDTDETDETGLCCALERGALQKALGRVLWAVPSHTTMPALTGIFCETDGDDLILRATNLQTAVSARCAADVTRPGSALIPGKLLKDLADRAPDGALRIEASEQGATVRWGKGKAKLATMPAEQYPSERDPVGDEVQVQASLFLRALRAVTFAAGRDTTRGVLTGIRLRIGGGAIDAMACDGLRVVRHTEPAETGRAEHVEVIVVAQDAERAAKVLAEAAESHEGDTALRLRIDPAFLQVATPTLTIQIGRMEGRYPAVEDLMPKEYPETARVDRAALAAALGRATLVTAAQETLHAVRMYAHEGNLALTAQASDVGTSEESLPGEVGPGFDLTLNGAMLIEALGRTSGETVLVESSGSQTATRVSGDDTRLIYWQMPIRIG